MKGRSYHNEGFRILPKFVCDAISFPAKAKKAPKSQSKHDPRKPKNGRTKRKNKKNGK